MHNNHVGLPAIHTLFLREHNRVCTKLQLAYPLQTDDDLFQTARNVTVNTVLNIVRTEYISSLRGGVLLTTPATMGPNILLARLTKQVIETPDLSPITAEFNLVYAWHSAVENSTQLMGSSKRIYTKDWFKNALGAINHLTHDQAFEKLINHARTTRKVSGGLNTLNTTPVFLRRAEEALLDFQRQNNVVCYNEARRQLGLSPYRNFEELVIGTRVTVSEMCRLFGSIENVDFYTGIRIDNTKLKPPNLLCDVASIVISTLAFGVLPLFQGPLQQVIPPCIQDEIKISRKTGFLSTLLQHHLPDSTVPICWTFEVQA
jgi:hypothetical protein